MTSAAAYSEDALVEKPAIDLLVSLGWSHLNCFYEFASGTSVLGRETEHDVVLVERLRSSLRKLNPDASAEALSLAEDELTRDRSALSPEAANRVIYDQVKDGVKVTVRQDDGTDAVELLRVVDWQQPANNDFFLTSQLWVAGDMYRRRCDLVGFINGLPLLFVELKATHKRLEDAYRDNLRDYRNAIPQLFWFNAFIVLSNGSASRMGSISAEWEHFFEWKRINDEGEVGVVSLETLIRGTCDPVRFLDIVENFTLFEETRGGLIKKIGKNHQVLGVNRALAAVGALKENRGRLGVFWHTQGSGKSVSMVFFSQKIMRTVPGNWTFVVVTDRQELDDQIYKQFARCGVVTEAQAQAESGDDLRRLLTEDHRYVFTLIQKFRTERGKTYPELSSRSDVIVITDEAHRSQYDVFAMNMRAALPNAAFIGFTGTPLIAAEEKTREVFGDYVSVYDFRQSREDGATVPLYYENRIPELQLEGDDLNDRVYEVIDDAGLDDEAEAAFARQFSRQYRLITREPRLERVAEDVVDHFVSRGYLGKAMFVAVDKATAVRMYDKVRAHWQARVEDLERQLLGATAPEAELIREKLRFMVATDMAVIVSQSQNEIEDLAKRGVDIVAHRKRMLNEDLDEKFKNPDDPLRLVFVCAMWMTGFDVPTCSTIYLDKPMRNHTLMQTIARANRVAEGKKAGFIVDYVGVFRNLQKALAIYAAPARGAEAGDPIERKAELVAETRAVASRAEEFLKNQHINPSRIFEAVGFERVALLDDAVDKLVAREEIKRQLFERARALARIYKALLPDPSAAEFAALHVLLIVLVEKVKALAPPVDVEDALGRLDEVLDEAIVAADYIIETSVEPVDLTRLDFDALASRFAGGRKHTETERLRGIVERETHRLAQLNHTRIDFLQRLQKMIDDYNAGSINIETFFAELLAFAKALEEEERRGIAESLSEEELAVFDILTRPDPPLSEAEKARVKGVVRELLESLKRERLVLDWRKRQQTRQGVRLCIEETLDHLPDAYSLDIYREKVERTYQHVYDAYFGDGRSVYTVAA